MRCIKYNLFESKLCKDHKKRGITGRILGGLGLDIDKDRDLHGVSREILPNYTSMKIFRATGGRLTNNWSKYS